MTLPSEVEARVEAAKTAYPGKRIRPVETAGGWLILRQPSPPEFRMWQEAVFSDDAKQISSATGLLLQSIVVDPDRAAFGALLAEYPGIPIDKDVVLSVRKLAGAAKESDLK
jgi:hypothetical protein